MRIARRRPDCAAVPAVLEFLEPRLLLTVFANADFNGVAALQGMHDAGTVALNGSGVITSAALTHEDGSALALTGTYNVSPTGTFTCTLLDGATTIYDATGAVNSTKDVAAENYAALPNATTEDAGLAFVVKHTVAFSNADLTGTWDMGAQGVRASVVFDGAGHITGGSFVAADVPSGGKITGGTYNVAADGTVTFTPQTNAPADQQPDPMQGTMNDSKNVLVLDNKYLGPSVNNPDYEAGDDAGLVVLVKRSGTYVAADSAGTWVLAGSSVKGTMTFNAAGAITGGSVTEESGDVMNLSGTYSISSGSVNCYITVTAAADPSQVEHFRLIGAMNGSKNFVELTPYTITDDNDDLITLIRSIPNTPSIDSLVANGTATRGTALALTAHDVAIPAPGAIAGVQFYRDTDGNGIQTRADTLLGSGVQAGSDWTLNAATLSLPLGSNRFFAVATDTARRTSNVVTTTVTVQNAAPALAGLQVVTAHVAASNPLSLLAVGPADTDGRVASVNFYWDNNHTGDPAQSTLLGAGTSRTKWGLTLANAPAGLPADTAVWFIAQAVDNDGGLSAVRSATVVTVARPAITNLVATPNPLLRTAAGSLTATVTGPDAAVSKVTFWLLPAATVFSPAAKATGLGVQAGPNWTLVIPASKMSKLVAGSYTVYAQALDVNGILSGISQINLNVV